MIAGNNFGDRNLLLLEKCLYDFLRKITCCNLWVWEFDNEHQFGISGYWTLTVSHYEWNDIPKSYKQQTVT